MTHQTTRFFESDELRVIDGPAGKPRIVGYAAVFNSLSDDLGGFREKIAPGAFAGALGADREILALMHHDPKLIVGRRSAGTLTLREDNRGLYVEIDPPDTSVGRDAVENLRRKDIKGMSFRFGGAKDTWEKTDGGAVRTLTKIERVPEVTLTPIPAYPSTSAALRDIIGDSDELRTYYKTQIDQLNGTPMRDHAERRLRLLES